MAKGNVDFRTQTSGIEKALSDLEDGIDEAVNEAANEIRSTGLRAAKNKIRRHDRIWNKEVLNAWTPVQKKLPDGSVEYGFHNRSVHAAVVDEGAVYPEKSPSSSHLKPWVVANLTPNPGQTYDQLAFTVAQWIGERGLTGIHYTETAREAMDAVSETEVHKQINKEFRGSV